MYSWASAWLLGYTLCLFWETIKWSFRDPIFPCRLVLWCKMNLNPIPQAALIVFSCTIQNNLGGILFCLLSSSDSDFIVKNSVFKGPWVTLTSVIAIPILQKKNWVHSCSIRKAFWTKKWELYHTLTCIIVIPCVNLYFKEGNTVQLHNALQLPGPPLLKSIIRI